MHTSVTYYYVRNLTSMKSYYYVRNLTSMKSYCYIPGRYQSFCSLSDVTFLFQFFAQEQCTLGINSHVRNLILNYLFY